MSSVFDALGIDLDELEWQDLALCSGMETNWFYEEYDDEQISHMVDEACLSCPVMRQCLTRGMENSEWGVWGGIYLVSGKKDDNKNKYKSPETWKQIYERLAETDDDL
jgi:hypothetical protein